MKTELAMHSERITSMLAIVTLLGGVGAGSATAGGFREQQSWQFRGPGELQANLARESLRQQLNRQESHTAHGVSAVGTAAPETAATTTGNMTNVTNSYSVTINGDGNTSAIDGYLNLSTSQSSEGQDSQVVRNLRNPN